jgi:antitoxin component of RelBE/YafQ-DinJ toxin-antitoxin module
MVRKEASLPVRLDTDISHRLDQAAERLGLTKSALIRILVKSFLDQLEADGGKMTLPFSWEESKTVKSPPSLRYVAEPKAQYGRKGGKR